MKKQQWDKFMRYTCFDVAAGPMIAVILGIPLALIAVAILLTVVAVRQIKKAAAARLAAQPDQTPPAQDKEEQS